MEIQRPSTVNVATTRLVACLSLLSLANAQESKSAPKLQDPDPSETLSDVAQDLQRRLQQGQTPTKGNAPLVVGPNNEADQTTSSEEKVITDTGMLSFLNFGLKELGRPLITMKELDSVDLVDLPREYFIVLNREGDGRVLSEWISGEFLRIRQSTWECWSPAGDLIMKNVVTGKMVVSLPDHRFVVFLRENGDLRSALLSIRARLWTINFSRPDGLSPVFSLVPNELFYEHLQSDVHNYKEK